MEKLKEFEVRMKDRFGPIPAQVAALFFSFELRWMAKKMGLERLVIKSEKMVCSFISDGNSPFYESNTFTEILQEITSQGNGYRLIQKQERLRLIIEPIADIKDAYSKLMVLNKIETIHN